MAIVSFVFVTAVCLFSVSGLAFALVAGAARLPGIAATRAGATSESSISAVLRYWTPDRMLAARPVPESSLPVGAAARSDVVRAGTARFEVLTATLIRAEYAADGRFENRPTMTATRSAMPVPRFGVRRERGWLAIRTPRMTLRYRLGSGPFAGSNLLLTINRSGRRVTVHPAPGSGPGNLGGWRRALDQADGPVALHPGLLARSGWYVLDDTRTVLLTPDVGAGFTVRSSHRGPYQDWYVFGYGHDYRRGLEDLRALTGPALLLPRSAFGVWFSRYYPYSASDYHTLLAQFRSHRIPLDTLSIDTDFKRESPTCCTQIAALIAGAPGKPYSWDGWEWDTKLFPHPRAFLAWAHHQGLSVALNIHPSIATDDPKWSQADAMAGGLRTTTTAECEVLIADPRAECGVFDWTKPRQIAAYFWLHREFEQDGADLFWLDWCCDASTASAPGLTADTWINSLYWHEQRARGTRWPAFARVGASYSASDGVDGDSQDGGTGIFAEHRYTIQFTGDTCATWAMLAFEAQFSAEEGNLGLPYVSDDIGSFHGQPVHGTCGTGIGTSALTAQLPADLYARWVAFGTFQPIDRLHSDHGNRLPWEYGAAADAAASVFLRLREALNPYIYTMSRDTYDTGLPITGALYLEWPGRRAAYTHPSEYTFGRDMVVEPVTADGDPAPAKLWVPPGRWIDYFTGRRFRGPRVVTLSVPLSQMPVLVRAGAVIPTEPYAGHTPEHPPRELIATAYPGGSSRFALYDDAGQGFGYQRGQYAWMAIVHSRHGRDDTVRIGATRGRFPGELAARMWIVRLLGVARPRAVLLDGRRLAHRRWSYNAPSRTVTVRVGTLPLRDAATVTATL